MKKSIVKVLATTVAAFGLYFAGYTYADASTTITVQAGDSIWGLSQKYNVTMDALEKANHINVDDVILVGQSLIIPDGTTTNYSTTQTNASYTTPVTTNTNYSNTNSNSTVATNSANATKVTKTTNTGSSSESSAKAWIANRESGGSYTATNGRYIGKYQLDSAYLNGDYSAANQEKVANQYVANRYGSWSAAQSFWQANGWY
ncbi:LysM peptidoglycan-binding domain-containing protein [Lentilactobacillus laojiaonis]|uniref:aggregation-promoting factor n=1 Tax=Lentilactobacillus laojiaonis TaxID=2883998 RepID=UPI001D0B813D|nr:LysM domain-containing protein [Lentilactobacillus laojiaonis]UDM32064.1 LysM peptidoglycan-binding domain-containing protein [Lentilactobacillus laojiaonis]